ncbi:MAG TPA: competence protein CoiA family protein, partial [Bacteroidales bacterium]|nr:competence protein CoiA family protein [Bacteroidales bacterium]
MQKALNLNNESIRPTYTGQRAICEVCGSAVVSKCGTIYPYHWAHKKIKDCDPWYEPKTAWHKKWQDYFPEHQQEIVVKKNDIYHRADILTQNGIVIEIQNSPISVECLKEREDFYQNMIWIVNGYKFINNLRSINLLKHKLKKLDFKTDFLVRKVQINKRISFINSKLIYYISYNKYFIEQLKIYTNDIAKHKNNLFFLETATIQDSINLIYSEYHSILYIYDTILKDFKYKRQYCLTEIKTFKKILDDLLNLPEHIIDGVSYRESPYIKLDLGRFKNVKALLKNDYNSLFKNYMSFDSEIELIYKNNKYDLVYFCDLSYLINDIEKRISDLNNIISIDQIEYDRILNIVKSNTIKSINESIIQSIENMNNYKLYMFDNSINNIG